MRLEIQAAQKAKKPIITLVEEDKRRQAFFDRDLAWEKYRGTEQEVLLNIDSVTYRRDAFEAKAMVERILAKAQTTHHSTECNTPLINPLSSSPGGAPFNHPGHWDFFLSHGQAAAGDQVKTLCLLLKKRGKTVCACACKQSRCLFAARYAVLELLTCRYVRTCVSACRVRQRDVLPQHSGHGGRGEELR